MRNNLGKYIRRQRELLGLTQVEYAKLIGFGCPQFVCRIERGKCGLPIQYWRKISKHGSGRVEEIISVYLLDEKIRLTKMLTKSI